PLRGAPLRERRAQYSQWRLRCGGRSVHTSSLVQGLTHVVEVDGVAHTCVRERQGVVRSPSPAIVVSVSVAEGDTVSAGDHLLVLEAMKMETSVAAPFAGRVREVLVMSNVQVAAGAPLLVIEADAEAEDPDASPRLDFAPLALPPEEDGAARRRRALQELRWLLLGFDVDPAQADELLAQAFAAEPGGQPPGVEELGQWFALAETFLDLCSLFRPRPAEEDELDEDVRLTTEEYLVTFLRDLDMRGARLPASFLRKLERALRHYDVQDVTRTPELEESLFRICGAHQREEAHAGVVLGVLDRCLRAHPAGPGRGAAAVRDLLDRLVAEMHRRYPCVHDLAREVRHRWFEQPLLEAARARVYRDVERH
ncbi:MAG TPA: acetyl-CoA carboxylase biotin carboxyl carrier protein subunit, partial [Vicinamibacteria bacterium]|nr:acetyl-CoA carboxylase biotin carboxyl carrier protein subunit [Vicinamibacteria bacterium]